MNDVGSGWSGRAFVLNITWKFTESRRHAQTSFKMVWSNKIFPNVSIVMWMIQHDLSLEHHLKKLKALISSKCKCCMVNNKHVQFHLFFNDDIANYMWRHFDILMRFKGCCSLGVSLQDGPRVDAKWLEGVYLGRYFVTFLEWYNAL